MEILRELRKKKKSTQKEVADYCGINFQTYGRYEKGQYFPDSVTLGKLAEYFDVTADLLLGKGPLIENIIDSQESRRPEESSFNKYVREFKSSTTLDFFISRYIYTRIPFGSNLDSLDSSLISSKPYKMDLPVYYFEKNKYVFAFTINDPLMEPYYMPGDIIIARSGEKHKDGDKVVVHIKRSDATVRTLRIVDGKVYLQSFNPIDTPIEVNSTLEIDYLGLVLESRRITLPLNYLGYIE